MTNEVTHWCSLSNEPISIDTIRSLHVPASHFKVSRNGYDAGVCFTGTRNAGRIYVLSGDCVESVGDWHAELGPATFVDFPAGAYKFTVIGDEPVRMVNVWEIPEQYRRSQAT